MKNRMLMSILALVSAALLLVFATFAWLTVSQEVNLGPTTINVLDIDASAILEYSTDGIDYLPVDQILIQNAVPGDIFYYRLIVKNTGGIDVSTNIFLSSFIDGVVNPLGYLSSNSLLDGVLLTASNTDNSFVVNSSLLRNILIGSDQSTARIMIASNVTLIVDEEQTIYFTVSISNAIGNDFRNLALSIAQIQVQLAQE